MASPRRMLFWIPSDSRNVAPPDPVPTPLDPRVNLASAHTSCRTLIARLRARIDAIGRESAPSHWSRQKPPTQRTRAAYENAVDPDSPSCRGMHVPDTASRTARATDRDHGTGGSDRSGERSRGCPTTELTQGERPARCSPRPRRVVPPTPPRAARLFVARAAPRDMFCRRLGGSRATRGRGEARRHRPSGRHWWYPWIVVPGSSVERPPGPGLRPPRVRSISAPSAMFRPPLPRRRAYDMPTLFFATAPNPSVDPA